MKTLILSMALATALTGVTALAEDYRHDDRRGDDWRNDDRRGDDRRSEYSHDRRDGLEPYVRHLNRMLEHVRWEVRRYHSDWRIRREVEQISSETDRINRRFRSGDYNGWRLRREVERLHERLHAIEQRLQVSSRDFYRWD
jgi:hypothetical protein